MSKAQAAAAAAGGFRLIKDTTSTSRPTVYTSVDNEDARLLPVAEPAVQV